MFTSLVLAARRITGVWVAAIARRRLMRLPHLIRRTSLDEEVRVIGASVAGSIGLDSVVLICIAIIRLDSGSPTAREVVAGSSFV